MNDQDIRWMLRRDVPSVLEIASESFRTPWTEDGLISTIRDRNVIGLVVEDGKDHISGYVIYEIHRNRLHILSLAVKPVYQRKRFGSQLVKKLTPKLSNNRRNRIILDVRETNRDGQLFFRAMGFKATSVIRGFYTDTKEDAYRMEYRHGVDSPAANGHGRLNANVYLGGQ